MRAPTFPTASLLAAALAALVAVQACGDTLIDHDGKDFITPDGGFTCVPPTHACPAGCVEQSVDACGASCEVCGTAPANGTRACLQGAQDFQCGYTCAAGFLECKTGCCRAAAVAAGGDHACAVADDGTLVCWGANESGQLGPNAVGASSPAPVRVLDSGVTAVAAGTAHTCAVHVGRLECWGNNGSGQLGNGTTQGGPAPVSTGLTGVTAVAAGRAHTCAVVAGGGVKCWGANASGQLGTGAADGGLHLSPVSSLAAGVSGIAAALDHVCALAGTAVSCWGANERGQSGSADLAPKPTPVPVTLPGAAAFVVTGHLHSCAGIPSPLGLHCWGDDRHGQLGTGTVAPDPVIAPVQASRIDNGQRSVGAAAGRGHTCSVKDEGTIKCGGLNDASQVGASPNDPELDGFDVGLGGVRSISAGNDHTCAVVDEGAPGTPALVVKCWGKNDKGQLGRDTAGNSSGVPDYVGK